jgi:hypothetical protein
LDSRAAQSRERAIKVNVGGEATENSEEGIAPHDMKLDIPDEDINLLITALEHYHSYTLAKSAEDARYSALADRLKRKPTDREPAEEQPAKNAKRRA